MTVALSGATGYLGLSLRNKLESEGHRVYPIGRGVRATSLAEDFKRHEVEAVYHLASLFIAEHKPDQVAGLIESNIHFGTEILEAMKIAGVMRFINAGTTWQTYHTPHSEYRPVALYSATKQAFENILAFYTDAYDIRAVTLRIFDTYGPADTRGKIVTKLLELARTGASIDLSPGEQELDLVHRDDIADAFLQALALIENRSQVKDHHLPPYFGLSSGRRIKLRDLVKLIEEITDKTIAVNWGGRPYRAREMMKPTTDYPVLPGWTAKISLEAGLKSIWSENV